MAPASALSMWALTAVRRRLLRPTTRAGWSGVFLAASLLGAAPTGALSGALVVLDGL